MRYEHLEQLPEDFEAYTGESPIAFAENPRGDGVIVVGQTMIEFMNYYRQSGKWEGFDTIRLEPFIRFSQGRRIEDLD